MCCSDHLKIILQDHPTVEGFKCPFIFVQECLIRDNDVMPMVNLQLTQYLHLCISIYQIIH